MKIDKKICLQLSIMPVLRRRDQKMSETLDFFSDFGYDNKGRMRGFVVLNKAVLRRCEADRSCQLGKEC